MAGLDLSGVKRVLDDWLEAAGTVVVARDFGTDDAELDPETGVLAEPGPRSVYVGPGAIQALSGFSQVPEIQQVLERTDARWRLLLPLDADGGEPAPGDEVWVDELSAATQDERLTRSIYEVVDVGGPSTWTVARFYYLKLARYVEELPTLPPPWPQADLHIAGILDEGEVPPDDAPEGTIYLVVDE